MNKTIYAAFSVLIALLLFTVMSLNFVTKVIASIAIIGYLLITMFKMILIVGFRKMAGKAAIPHYNVYEMHHEQVKYA